MATVTAPLRQIVAKGLERDEPLGPSIALGRALIHYGRALHEAAAPDAIHWHLLGMVLGWPRVESTKDELHNMILNTLELQEFPQDIVSKIDEILALVDAPDVLWKLLEVKYKLPGNRYLVAQDLVPACLKAARLYADSETYMLESALPLERAFAVAYQMKNEVLKDHCWAALNALISDASEKQLRDYGGIVGNLLSRNDCTAFGTTVAKLTSSLSAATVALRRDRRWLLLNETQRLLASIAKALGNHDDERAWLLAEVQSLEEQAEHQLEQGGELVAGVHLHQAMARLHMLRSKFTDDEGEQFFKALKRKTAATHRAWHEKGTSKPITVEIDAKPLQQKVAFILSAVGAGERIRRLVESGFPSEIEHVKANVAAVLDKTLAWQIATTQVFDGPRAAGFVTEDQALEFHTNLAVRNVVLLHAQAVFAPVTRAFVEDGTLDEQMLASMLEDAKLFPPERKGIVSAGLANWSAGRWIEAVHILVPVVEDAVRRVVFRSGGDTQSWQSGVQREKSLEECLEAAQTQNGPLNANLSRYLSVIFTAAGANTRNTVCHRLVADGGAGSFEADCCVYSLLQLCWAAGNGRE